MDKRLKLELDRTVKRLKGIEKVLSPRVRKKVYRENAELFVKSAQSHAPKSKKPHFRYSNSGKLSRKIRAPKGKGKIVATYTPGNLKRSIQVLRHGKFRRLSSVYVGPRVQKRGQGKGLFNSSSQVDGYYAHIIEFGSAHSPPNPFMRRAYREQKGKVTKLVVKNFARRIRKYKKSKKL